jgi:hypothetical protein
MQPLRKIITAMKYLSLYSVGFILIMMLSFFSFYKKDILGRQGRLLQGLRQSPAGNSLFAETFEGPTPFAAVENTDFGTPYSFSVVSRPVYKGSKSARFELRDTDPMVSNGTRAEVTVVKDAVQREMWYSFAVYFPADDFAPDTKTEIISQWWQAGDNHLGEANSSPATALRIQNDRFILVIMMQWFPQGLFPKAGRRSVWDPSLKTPGMSLYFTSCTPTRPMA